MKLFFIITRKFHSTIKIYAIIQLLYRPPKIGKIMKKILAMLTLLALNVNCMASQATTNFVGVFWSKHDPAPIVHPMLFPTKKDCETEMKKMNEITIQTIKVSRQYSCNPVMFFTKMK